jgi:hypothetical protein
MKDINEKDSKTATAKEHPLPPKFRIEDEISEFNFSDSADLNMPHIRRKSSDSYQPKYQNNLGDILSEAVGGHGDVQLLGYAAQKSAANQKSFHGKSFTKLAGKLSGAATKSYEKIPLPSRNDHFSKSSGPGDHPNSFKHEDNIGSSSDFNQIMGGSVRSSKLKKTSSTDLQQSPPSTINIQNAVYSFAGMPMNIRPESGSSNFNYAASRAPKPSKSGNSRYRETSSESSASARERKTPNTNPAMRSAKELVLGKTHKRETSSGSNEGGSNGGVCERKKNPNTNPALRSAKELVKAVESIDQSKPRANQSQNILASPQRRNNVSAMSQADLNMLDDGEETYGGTRTFWEKLRNPIEVYFRG